MTIYKQTIIKKTMEQSCIQNNESIENIDAPFDPSEFQAKHLVFTKDRNLLQPPGAALGTCFPGPGSLLHQQRPKTDSATESFNINKIHWRRTSVACHPYPLDHDRLQGCSRSTRVTQQGVSTRVIIPF